MPPVYEEQISLNESKLWTVGVLMDQFDVGRWNPWYDWESVWFMVVMKEHGSTVVWERLVHQHYSTKQVTSNIYLIWSNYLLLIHVLFKRLCYQNCRTPWTWKMLQSKPIFVVFSFNHNSGRLIINDSLIAILSTCWRALFARILFWMLMLCMYFMNSKHFK